MSSRPLIVVFGEPSERWSAQAATMDASIAFVPLSRFEAVPGVGARLEDILRGSQVDTVLVTSHRAVDYLRALKLSDATWAVLSQASFAAVGPRTAEAARAAGLQVHFTAENAAATVELMQKQQKQSSEGASRVLRLGGSSGAVGAADRVSRCLEERAIEADFVQLYQTTLLSQPQVAAALQQACDAQKSERLWGVLLSPAGLSLAKTVLKTSGYSYRIAALGPTTAVDAQKVGLEISAVAAAPTPEQAFDAIFGAAEGARGD